MDLYAYTVLNALLYFVEEIVSFFDSATLFGLPFSIYIILSFLMISTYKWILSPVFSGGVSAGASDSVKAVGKGLNNNRNDSGKWRDR